MSKSSPFSGFEGSFPNSCRSSGSSRRFASDPAETTAEMAATWLGLWLHLGWKDDVHAESIVWLAVRIFPPINGHFRNNIWPYMVRYLHFRILKFPLTLYPNTIYPHVYNNIYISIYTIIHTHDILYILIRCPRWLVDSHFSSFRHHFHHLSSARAAGTACYRCYRTPWHWCYQPFILGAAGVDWMGTWGNHRKPWGCKVWLYLFHWIWMDLL